MARTTTIDSDEILRVARHLFLKRGLDVPTSEIAKQVGVSEGSIFKRFPTKRALFIASMGIDDHPDWMTTLGENVGEGELKENLQQLCLKMIDYVRGLLPRMMLLWSCREPACPAENPHAKPTSPPRVLLTHLTDYLDQEMRLGRMRAAHPEVVSRMLMGSVWNYVFLETMGRQQNEASSADDPQFPPPAITGAPSMNPNTYAHSVIETLWSGVAPHPFSLRGED
jgi:AcrR family transcriptional regulator